MTTLWIALGFLLLLSVGFVVWPLWRYRVTPAVATGNKRDTEPTYLSENVRIFREHLTELENSFAEKAIDATQFAQLKLELERNLLEDEKGPTVAQVKPVTWLGPYLVVVFAAVVMVGGVVFYYQHSSIDDVAIQALQKEKMQRDYEDMQQNRQPDSARVHQLISVFEDRLKAKPESVQYWFMLARTQMEVANFAEAAKAYEQILQRDPQSPMIMAELAQAMFLRDSNRMSQPIADLAKQAITLDPKNTMALGLLGIDAFNQKNYSATIRYWQKSVDILGPHSSGALSLLAGIERAKTAFVAEGGKLEDLTAKSSSTITLSVSLGSRAKVNPDDTVFIYARAWQGSPMPLAILRIKVSELPKTIQLDESMAMSPVASLATAAEVEVVARVSAEGSAKAKVGEWQAKQGPVSMKAVPASIDLTINEQVTE